MVGYFGVLCHTTIITQQLLFMSKTSYSITMLKDLLKVKQQQQQQAGAFSGSWGDEGGWGWVVDIWSVSEPTTIAAVAANLCTHHTCQQHKQLTHKSMAFF